MPRALRQPAGAPASTGGCGTGRLWHDPTVGYGIILASDDRAVRSTTDEDLEGLAGHLVGQSYPSAGLAPGRFGPWQVVGAYHSNEQVGLVVHADGTAERAEDDLAVGLWVPALTPTALAVRTKEILRDPRQAVRYQQLVARGVDATTAMFPERPVAADATTSLWVLYTDSLSHAHPELIVATFRQAVGVPEDVDGFRLGSMSPALVKVGSLHGTEPALVRWHANWVTAA